MLGLNLTDGLVNGLIGTDINQDRLETAGLAEPFQRLGCLIGFVLASNTGKEVEVCMIKELRG